MELLMPFSSYVEIYNSTGDVEIPSVLMFIRQSISKISGNIITFAQSP